VVAVLARSSGLADSDATLDDLDDRLAEVTSRLDEIARTLAATKAPLPVVRPSPVRPPAVLLSDEEVSSSDSGASVQAAIEAEGTDRAVATRRWLSGLLMLPMVLVGAAFAVCAAPTLLGYRVMAVNGGSMEPSIPLGSIAVTKLEAAQDVAMGDVILVNGEGDGKARFLHRVEQLREEDGQRLARTHGDANDEVDPEWVVLEGRIPTLSWSMPLVGFLMTALLTPIGWVSLVLLPAGLTCGAMLRSIWRA
jgi:signal peptidase I